MGSRRVEIICGVLGGTLGLAALGVGLFAPLELQCFSTASKIQADCSHVSLMQTEGLANLSFAIMLFGGLSLGIILFALWDGLARQVPALVLLWVCTVLLWGATSLALLRIGILFVPADMLALVAGIAGTVAAGRRAPAGA